MVVATQEAVTNLTAEQAPTLDNKHLISDQLWVRLTNRIVKDEGIELPMAERIMDQALGFLFLCGQNTSAETYSPSEQVDIGWHTFILYTREYQQFCQQIAGRFIHHSPSDEEGVDYGTGNAARTAQAMKLYGITVDADLWKSQADCDCGGCASGCMES